MTVVVWGLGFRGWGVRDLLPTQLESGILMNSGKTKIG